MNTICSRLQDILATIQLTKSSGNYKQTVNLLAVSKGQSTSAVREAYVAGQKMFGENYVQELIAKQHNLPKDIQWHFIGHLQSNKCREAVELFAMIESVDSLGLAQEINKRAAAVAKTMPILLEVNVAGEASKFGYQPERLLAELKAINALPRIEIHGLMAVPPWASVVESSRPHFRRLRELKRECEQILGAPLPHLSMGMSGDFEVAIEEGATIVRVGTALFGTRASAKSTARTDEAGGD